MIGIGEPHRFAHLGDRQRRAEEEFPRFLELPSDHVALGGNAQVAAEEFQHVRAAAAHKRGHLLDPRPEVEATLHMHEQPLELLGPVRRRRAGARGRARAIGRF